MAQSKPTQSRTSTAVKGGEHDVRAELGIKNPTASKNLRPGDEAPEGMPGSGLNSCTVCSGTGKKEGKVCPNCEGTGMVNVGIGGA